MTSDNLKKQLDDYLAAWPETRFMEPLITDMNGILRGKRVGVKDLGKAFENGVNTCAATVVLDTLGSTFSSIPNGLRDGDPDVKAMAVPGSLAPVPWATLPTAQVLLEMINLDGSPHENDPRNVLRGAMQPLVAAIFPIPKIALLPLFIIWFGIGEGSKVATILFGSFFPTVIATYSGIDNVDRGLIRMGQSFNLSYRDIVRKIVLPAALPAILSGMRI